MNKLFNIIKKLKKSEILELATKRCKHGETLLAHPNCIEDADPKYREKIGFLDIEATNLKANFGYMFTYCIKELDGPMIANSVTQEEILTYKFDKRLVKDLCCDLRKFDRVVVHYGSDYKFDLPFVRTRAVHFHLDFPLYKEVAVSDTHAMLKAKFKFHNNRLETACDFFDIPSKGHRLQGEIWCKALAGHPASLKYILTHNKEDVISLEELYKRIISYSRETKRSI